MHFISFKNIKLSYSSSEIVKTISRQFGEDGEFVAVALSNYFFHLN